MAMSDWIRQGSSVRGPSLTSNPGVPGYRVCQDAGHLKVPAKHNPAQFSCRKIGCLNKRTCRVLGILLSVHPDSILVLALTIMRTVDNPSPSLSIRLKGNPQTRWRPGNTVTGLIAWTEPTACPRAQVTISLCGESNSTIQKHRGLTHNSYLGRFVFFGGRQTSQVVHRDLPLNIKADSGGHLGSSRSQSRRQGILEALELHRNTGSSLLALRRLPLSRSHLSSTSGASKSAG